MNKWKSCLGKMTYKKPKKQRLDKVWKSDEITNANVKANFRRQIEKAKNG